MQTKLLAMALLLALAASCKSPSTPDAASSGPAAAEAPRPPSAAAESSAGTALGDVAPMDLSAHGLPLIVDVPRCAKWSEPLVKIADNARDAILTCESPDGATFAIQLSLSKGTQWKKDIAEMPGFKGFTKEEPDFLQYQEGFDAAAQTFILRTKVGGTGYACFSQFASADKAQLAAMIAACRSLRAK